jgi:DNA-binding LytR/AlgR family response regulator
MRTEIKLPGIVNCPIKDIVYIEGKGNYSLVYLATKKEVYIAKTLKKFESHFRMHKFIRIHKSFLVNQENIPPMILKFHPYYNIIGKYIASITAKTSLR